jgi:hypothetical protein
MVVGFIEDRERLVLVSPMPSGKRVGFALMGLVPLLAPYELLLRVGWQSYLHPFFVLAVIVSAGALAVSALFLFAAVAGLASRITMDANTSTLTYSHAAPVVPEFIRTRRLDSIAHIDTRTHQWTDGPSSYSLRIVTSDGTAFESSASWSRDDIARIKEAVESFLLQYKNRPAL